MAAASPESGESLPALAASRDFEYWKLAALRLTLGWYWRQDSSFRFVEVEGKPSSLGIATRQWLGRTRWEWPPNCMPESFWEAHRRELALHKPFSDLVYEVLAEDGTGRSIWVRVNGEPLWDENGAFAGYHGFGWEVTARRRAEIELYEREQSIAATAQRIEHLARHDVLTHLPNRGYLVELLGQALQEARDASRWLAVLVVNLDRFKLVNDAMGHAAGDRLLHSAAQRLRDGVPPGSIVARIGGDEFAVVLRHDSEGPAPQETGERLRKALAAPHRVEGHDILCTVSIGGALFPQDGDSPGTLLQNADAAMTRAKSLGRNNLRFFSASLRQALAEQLELEFDLRQALSRGEFMLHFQPQVEAMTGALVGTEALLRWRHPVRGLVPPSLFVPLAENSGLIVEIGAWVLDEACRQLRAWREQGLDGVTMAVNLSAYQLREPSLVPDVDRALKRHGLCGSDLELELTESVAMEDPGATIEVLRRLRELGVQLSIDDFGTGYSSLSYLKLLPIHRLKLDRSFVKDIESDPNDAAICSATIALAHKLKLAVVAEGVETALQRNYLLSNGCDYLQGYLFSAPVPPVELALFAQAHPPQRPQARRATA